MAPATGAYAVWLACRRCLLAWLQGVAVKEVPTKPYDGQKTGTSGLRKKTKEFMQVSACAGRCMPARADAWVDVLWCW